MDGMRRASKGSVLPGFVLAALAVAVAAAPASPAEAAAHGSPASWTAATRSDCAPVLVLGARGSGQPQGGSPADGGTGLGEQVFRATQVLQRRLPAGSVEVASVVYPALGVELLATDSTAYISGLERGVAWVKDELASRAATCPDQRIVLMGYSQGAMVMNRVVRDLAAGGESGAAALARLDGALLLADGDRAAGDGARQWGTARKGVGLSRQYASLTGARPGRLAPSLGARVQSVCDRGDRVCDFTGASGPSRYAGEVHTTHYKGSPPVRRAIGVIVQRLPG